MADVDHPKTHVEDDKDAKLPRTQPESPKHEGIDPLTESDTMYPAEDTKDASAKLSKKVNDTPAVDDENGTPVEQSQASKAKQGDSAPVDTGKTPASK